METLKHTDMGTHRGRRGPAALDPDLVWLDDASPEDLLLRAMGQARELRYLGLEDIEGRSWETILSAASDDWSGYLGEPEGPLHQAFRAFFQDPGAYVSKAGGALSQPHVALFAVFLHILQHARTQLNAFPRRHLDHYFEQVLGMALRPMQPAEAYVTFSHAEETDPTYLPEGTLLRAGEDEGPQLETLDSLSLNKAAIAQLGALRASYRTTGFRAWLQPESTLLDMAGIRAHVMARGLGTRLAEKGWASLEALVADMADRSRWRHFPTGIFLCSLDEFRQMMAFAPDSASWQAADEALMGKWEGLHARMVIAEQYPNNDDAQVADAFQLENKLSAALFNGHLLPPYKGAALDMAALHHDCTQTGDPAATALALNYLRRHLFLEEGEFKAMYAQSQERQGLPKYPAAVLAAALRKAATLDPMLLGRSLDRVAARSVESAALSGIWAPFGQAPVEPSGHGLQDLALLVESPMLAMAEGERSVRLRIDLGEADLQGLAALVHIEGEDSALWSLPFDFELTTAKDWIQLDWRSARPILRTAERQLEVMLVVPDAAPAVTGPGADFPVAAMRGLGPCLRLRMRKPSELAGDIPLALQPEAILRNLRIDGVGLQVTVKGITDFQAANHQGEVKASAPFEPFGTQLEPNATFMIANRELCLKQIDRVDLALEWSGAPADFLAHYGTYFDAMEGAPVPVLAHDRADFKARAEFVSGRWAHRIGGDDVSFLTGSPQLQVEGELKALHGVTEADIAGWDMPSDWPRYLRLVYSTPWSPDQVHDEAQRRHFAALLSASNAFAAASIAYNIDPEGSVNNVPTATTFAAAQAKLTRLSGLEILPPYVPKLKQMRLGYVASQEITVADWQPQPEPHVALYHQMPLGISPLPVGAGASQPLFAQFEAEGMAMIGFSDLAPGQSLSLLLKPAMGTGSSDVPPPPVEWWYHGALGWRQLPAFHVTLDETKGLSDRGLLRIEVPADASVAEQALPGKLRWLGLRVMHDCQDLPSWEGLHLHAVRARQLPGPSATWELKAGSVTGLEVSNPSVGVVSQPYNGYGGKPAESPGTFFQRISERLRHKGRALAAWDYEHLCLDEFPQIYAAKTVQARADEHTVPGTFQLVVVPSLHGQLFADRFRPRFGYGELADISGYLRRLAPPSAQVAACNPTYRQVSVVTTLSFKDGISSNMGRHMVEERIKQYLAPWAYDKGSSMSFGGRLYLSEIVQALQAEPYVYFVGKTRLFVSEPGGGFSEAQGRDGDTSAYIEVSDTEVLTSAESHIINEVGEEEAGSQIWEGISWMVVGADFEVKVDPNTPPIGYEEWVGVSWMVIGKDFKVEKSNLASA